MWWCNISIVFAFDRFYLLESFSLSYLRPHDVEMLQLPSWYMNFELRSGVIYLFIFTKLSSLNTKLLAYFVKLKYICWTLSMLMDWGKVSTELDLFFSAATNSTQSQCACMSQHTSEKPLCQTVSRQEGGSHPQRGSVIIPKHCAWSLNAGHF